LIPATYTYIDALRKALKKLTLDIELNLTQCVSRIIPPS